MGLKIIKNGSGEFCRVWYGRLSRNGRKVDRALDIAIDGKIPTTAGGQWDRAGKGDAAFEASKKKALAAFNDLIETDGDYRKKIRSTETKLLALTGQETGKTQLSALAGKWAAIVRDRKPTKGRTDAARITFNGFAAFADTFARDHGFRCSTLEGVTKAMAAAYFHKLTTTLAWGTARDKYGLLRNAWRRWAIAPGKPNPFVEVVVRKGAENTGRISRVPLTADEARRLFEIVQDKRPALFPLLACVATTGLRLGDACRLEWADVHIEKNEAERRRGNYGTIGRATEELRTSKTGARVILPIIQPFADVVLDLERKRDAREAHVFPDMFERYEKASKRSGLIREIKPFFALAVKPDAAEKKFEAVEVDETGEPKEITLEEVVEAIRGGNFADGKKDRLEKVARSHFAGFASVKIAEDLGLARSQVSEYLRDLEDLTGAVLRKATKRRRALDLNVDRRTLMDLTRKGRSVGRYQASIYGWHSLRATFVVLAVEAGVPLAYVEKAVGHSMVQTTLQYFNPTGKHAADIIGRKVGGTFAAIESAEPVETVAVQKRPTIDELAESLTDEERKALARKLLGL